ncbi:DUF7286 family protein [Haloplanus pelagicus]|uniref:DUF7286 family protein n=1 Tax=Haloplanus pelagicus TaxID=2949995 RepID=UPI00204082A7|nr:hypothetical protein [Haloplanus sp. HW8-1]
MTRIRLADDRRGRVPFALIGVLLLVGASTYAATVTTQGPSRLETGAEVAMERTSAETTAVLRSAVGEAARAAAAEPVTAPAGTAYGRLLSEEQPFRDALRLRIYRTLRERLRATRHRRGDVSAVASLPAATTPAELRRAMDRIRVAGVENGTALRVTVRKRTITVRNGERVVDRKHRIRTVTVATPVLSLHDRAMTFETRLNRGPLEGSGLGRRLTARLYPIAWARGYAQYGGVPVTNVVATRHVETATNGALLETQRAVFGRSDPAGRTAMRRATRELGVRELTAATSVDSAWADRVLPRPNPRVSTGDKHPLPTRRGTSGPSPTRRLDVDVGPLAGRSLTGLRTGATRTNRSLADVLRAAYRVESKLRTRSRRTYHEPRPDPDPPGPEWDLAETRVETDGEASAGVASPPTAAASERRFAAFSRNVVLEHRVKWTWERGNDTRTTTAEWTDRYRVGVTLVGTYAPNGTAPDRPASPLFERGGPIDGPNLADVPGKARSKLLDRQGGREGVAVAVANGSLGTRELAVYGDRPADLRSWTYRDLSKLRSSLSNRSVGVRAGRIATYTANPPARLAASLRERRGALIDPPEGYRGAADRARVAARAALVDATLRRLNRRAATHERTREAFDEALGRAGVDSPRSLHRILTARRAPIPTRRERLAGTPPGGPVRPVPDGSPAYLTVASVGHDRARGVPPSRPYHPLSTANVNLFAAPYGDAADAVTAAAPDVDRPSAVRLRTAARVLLASRPVANGSVREPRRELRDAVAGSIDDVGERAHRAVSNETRLSRLEAEAAVAAGTARWDGPGPRALAAANGSLAEAIALAAARRTGDPTPRRVSRLEVRLDVAIADALRTPETVVSQSLVNETMSRVRARALERADAAVTKRLQRSRLNRTLGAVPAGLPVAPVPGYWYATVNVWNVEVKGAYARFTVRTGRGAPTPGGATRYVRDGSIVRFDVDGDGEAERLGRDERIDFRTRTVVAVAVPPYRNGVGDVDGDADERAGTWPEPGCTSWAARACPAAD